VGDCKLDHSLEDVRKKLSDQAPFMDQVLVQQLETFLSENTGQATLNEIFHLLKKFDLASVEERADREHTLRKLIGA
jgi:hypothetical protein